MTNHNTTSKTIRPGRRRAIWISDELWRLVEAQAEAEEISCAAIVRRCIRLQLTSTVHERER